MVDHDDTDIDRRTVLKLTGAAAVAGIYGTGSVAAENHGTVPGEIEGTLQSVDEVARTITVLGVEIDVPKGTQIRSPTEGFLTLADVGNGSFRGRNEPGFLGGTAASAGVISLPGEGEDVGSFTADNVFVEIAEHVIVGPVTEADFTGYEAPADGSVDNTAALDEGTFRVHGTLVKPVNDERLPLRVIHGELNTEVDITTVGEGSLVSAEGHLGDGRDVSVEEDVLYAHTMEVEQGDPADGATLNITRAECEPGRLRVRGTSSETEGTVELYNDETNEFYGSTVIDADPDEAIGGFRFDIDDDIGDCPEVVRVEHVENGSSATASVDID